MHHYLEPALLNLSIKPECCVARHLVLFILIETLQVAKAISVPPTVTWIRWFFLVGSSPPINMLSAPVIERFGFDDFQSFWFSFGMRTVIVGNPSILPTEPPWETFFVGFYCIMCCHNKVWQHIWAKGNLLTSIDPSFCTTSSLWPLASIM